jgi:hypothetical protein
VCEGVYRVVQFLCGTPGAAPDVKPLPLPHFLVLSLGVCTSHE